jgi:hypothetical protein
MRKTGLAAAGLVLVMGLAACGTREAGTPVAATDANTSNDGGSGGNGTLKVFGNALDLAGAVKDNNKATSAKMSMEMAGGAESITANGAFRMGAGGAAMQMTMQMAQVGTMEMVVVDKVLYMKLPTSLAGQAGLPADKPWVKISADGTDPLSKTLGPLVSSLDSNFDISKQMEQVKAAGTIDKTAKETLNGEQVTHYWLTIDLQKAVQNLPDPEMRKLAEQGAAASSTKTIKEEMWVNADNLPVQVVAGTPAIAGQPAGSVTVKYTDWGKPVDIKAPKPEQISELPH